MGKIARPEHTPRFPYPWETEANLPRITKEYFRCRGSVLNAPIVDLAGNLDPTPLSDCDAARHGLPVIQGKEAVYPVLLDLLNYLQQKTMRRVIVTCGHRCPAHNRYADPSKSNLTSKHQIGAEVDFYVQGMEDEPHEIVALLMQYYQEHPAFKNQKEWAVFQRYEKEDAHVATPPWMNKEIYIKLYQKDEGRDIDNRHPYPYLSIQVRYDRDKKERVVYSYERAHRSFPRN